mmetsp:Transcript_643/g.2249  ORF Transcript_643/g.2249 Transcript_643/m.2249 type:complete len:403 (+) Transcript_643:532-1740(+)
MRDGHSARAGGAGRLRLRPAPRQLDKAELQPDHGEHAARPVDAVADAVGRVAAAHVQLDGVRLRVQQGPARGQVVRDRKVGRLSAVRVPERVPAPRRHTGQRGCARGCRAASSASSRLQLVAGTEAAYEEARRAGMPDTVHKTSCGGDWWQLGSYDPGAPRSVGSFKPTPGWEDVFAQKRIDQGNFYASKDNEYPTLAGGKRRINWGWATVPPASAQTLPREVTFNAEARALQQYPIEEIAGLRAAAAFDRRGVAVRGSVGLGVPAGVARQAELLVSFSLPSESATFGVRIGGSSSGDGIGCSVNYTAGAANASVACGGVRDSLPLLARETSVELRVFADWTFVEAYFQRGRVAITAKAAFSPDTVASLTSNVTVAADVSLFPMKSIWVDPDKVRAAPRVYK